MSEEIERHVVRKFEICQRLGKGVSLRDLRGRGGGEGRGGVGEHGIMRELYVFVHMSSSILLGLWNCLESC